MTLLLHRIIAVIISLETNQEVQQALSSIRSARNSKTMIALYVAQTSLSCRSDVHLPSLEKARPRATSSDIPSSALFKATGISI